MMLFMVFIIILNLVAIGLTYYCLEGSDKKNRLLFIAIGIAVMYMLTSFIYWISTNGIEIQEVSDSIKDLIIFLFVPINGIVALPLIAKSYVKYKNKRLAVDKLRNRIIVIGVILIIVLILECVYFTDIQNGIISMISK